MKANCNDWLMFRDERHTLAHVSKRRVTTTNESMRIITHLNLLSSFEYLIMFSSSSYHIQMKQAAHQVQVVLSSKWKIYNAWGCSMRLLWHTKKSFSNKLSSTSSSEADLGGNEEPEYVAYWEVQGCTPRYAPIWHLWSAQGLAQKRRS